MGYIKDDPLLMAYHNMHRDLRYKHRVRHHDDPETFLSYDEMVALLHQPCHYCGTEPSIPIFDSDGNVVAYKGTIDRVDPTKGYRSHNCVPACRHCNNSKSTYTVDEYLTLCKLVYEHMHLQDYDGVDITPENQRGFLWTRAAHRRATTCHTGA